MIDIQNYKFRAHSIGNIMGGIPKPLTENQEAMFNDYTARKNGEGKPLTTKQEATWGELYNKKHAKVQLNDSAKKYLEELLWQELTGRTNKVTAKYLDKGIEVEEKSISLYSNVCSKMFFKNEERKENSFFSGECDNISDGVISDIKSSYEFKTFPIREDKIPNKKYEWQLDVYMDLWDVRRSKIIYCLVDTPFHLIEDELRRLDWKYNILDNDGNLRMDKSDLVVEKVSSHIYSAEGLRSFCEQSPIVPESIFHGNFREIPEELRVKIFEHEFCEKRNLQLKQMVELARAYMMELLENMNAGIQKLNVA